MMLLRRYGTGTAALVCARREGRAWARLAKPIRAWHFVWMGREGLGKVCAGTTVLEQDQFYSSYSYLYLSKETSLLTMQKNSSCDL